MKKFLKIFATVTISLLCLSVLGYLYGAFYFRDWFCPNTYINGIDVSRKSFDVTDEIVESVYVFDDYIIEDERSENIVIPGSQLYKYDVNDVNRSVQIIKESENSLYWGYYLFNKHEYHVEPEFYVDEEFLYETINQSEIAHAVRYDVNNKACIKHSESRGYYIFDETKDLLDWDMLKEVALEGANNRVGTIDLSELGVYKSLEETDEYIQTYRQWNAINDVIDYSFTYHLASGDDIVVDSSVISKLLKLDEHGKVYFDENGNAEIDPNLVHEYVQTLSDEYDNFYKSKKFKSTRGDIVEIPYSRYTTYGNLMDVEKESEELYDILRYHNGSSEREPVYIHKEDKGRNCDNYGGTYIEIDVTNQVMYYYEDGKIKFQTDVVTGCQCNGNMTPQCVCFIWNKATNAWLVGPDYRSYVYYWLGATGQIGIHDATWRWKFGGQIYIYGGSHGCVNTPIDNMATLFDMVEVGIPIIILH